MLKVPFLPGKAKRNQIQEVLETMGKTDTLGLAKVMNGDVNAEFPWGKWSVDNQYWQHKGREMMIEEGAEST